MARVYADSARLGTEQTLADTPDDPQRRIVRGLALAYMGRKAEAIREGERGLALLPASGDGYTGPYLEHLLARIYILAGEHGEGAGPARAAAADAVLPLAGVAPDRPDVRSAAQAPAVQEAGGGHRVGHLSS